MIYTYLLKSAKLSKYYVEISENPLKRILKHNSGGVKSTQRFRPYQLVYKKEHQNYSDARKHEKWLKKKSVDYKNKLAELAQLAPPLQAG